MSPHASLPDAWIARIFGAMRASYGAAFDRQWDPPGGATAEESAGYAQAVKAHWASELGGFIRAPNAIAFALDNLPDSPPNLIQFKALCQRRPESAAPQLPAPQANPSRVAAELDRMRKLAAGRAAVQWAHDLQDREARETPDAPSGMTQFERACWREALASSAADAGIRNTAFYAPPPDTLPPGMREAAACWR